MSIDIANSFMLQIKSRVALLDKVLNQAGDYADWPAVDSTIADISAMVGAVEWCGDEAVVMRLKGGPVRIVLANNNNSLWARLEYQDGSLAWNDRTNSPGDEDALIRFADSLACLANLQSRDASN